MGWVEGLKIFVGCIAAAVLYGIVHDQITARICVEYFSVFHPPVFGTTSPTLLALGWGVIATWWVGAILGMLLIVAARAGSWPRLTFEELRPNIGRLLLVMAGAAIVCGFIGYRVDTVPPVVKHILSPEKWRRFNADWWAHGASYASGFLGGLTVCGLAFVKRRQLARGLEFKQ